MKFAVPGIGSNLFFSIATHISGHRDGIFNWHWLHSLMKRRQWVWSGAGAAGGPRDGAAAEPDNGLYRRLLLVD